MSRVARFTRYGDPATVVELIDEDPGAPGPGEVLVAMEAACLHIADLKRMRGETGFAPALPAVPGAEGVGRVIAAGEGVLDLQEGDRVLTPLGAATCREVARLPAEGLITVDGDADVLQLAMATVNPPTAYVLLDSFVTLAPGDWVLMNAANSATCRYLIQLAASIGVRTICAIRRLELADELTALGATAVVTDGGDLAEQVTDATQGAELRLGLDAVAGGGTAQIAHCLAESGTIVTYGILSGEDARLPVELILGKGLRLHGFMTSRAFRERYRPDQEREIRQQLAALVADGKLSAKIAAVYPLERISEALTHAGATGTDRDGKVIVTMSGSGARPTMSLGGLRMGVIASTP